MDETSMDQPATPTSATSVPEADLGDMLENPETPVATVLAHSEFSQRLEYQSLQLFTFFQKPQVATLLPYITEFPPDPSDSQRCHQFPFLACELLCSRSICEMLVSEEELMQMLFRPLKDETVDLVLIGYITKVISSIAGSEKSEALLGWLFDEKCMAECLLRHTYSLSVTDVLVTLLNSGTGFISEKSEILLTLVSLIRTGAKAPIRANATRAVIDVIAHSEVYRSIQDVAKTLFGEEALRRLSEALEGKDDRACRLACQTLKALLGTQMLRAALGEPSERNILDFALAKMVLTVQRQMQATMKKTHSAELQSLLTSLLCALCKVDIPHIKEVILSTGVLQTATKLFLEQEMNSFLSCEYYRLAEVVCSNAILRQYFIKSVGIQQSIIGAFATPTWTPSPKNPKSVGRRPLLGFLTKISNLIISSCSMEGETLQKSKEWDSYVTTTLQDNNQKEQPFPQIFRRSSSLSQDLNEDIMLQNAPLPAGTKSEDVRASEESTTPVIRQRALNVKSKLLGMDDELSAEKPAAPTSNMNPVYASLLPSAPPKP